MPTPTDQAPLHHGPDGTSRSADPSSPTAWPLRRASIAAGAGLLLMAVLAGFAYLVAIDGLVTPGDAARTAQDITASAGLFRLGVVGLLLVVALDVVVAWALYRVFRPVSHAISMLAAAFRLVYAGVFAVAVGHLAGVPGLLAAQDGTSGLTSEQLQAQALLSINAFDHIWNAGLVLFGLHLLVVAYLAYRSSAAPKTLGILIGIAGLGYVFDSLAPALSAGAVPEMSTFTFIGELLLALWLLLRSGRREPELEASRPAA